MTTTLKPVADIAPITGGSHALIIECPDCDKQVTFPIEIKAELRILSENGGKLRPVISVKAQEHNCNGIEQPTLGFEGSGDNPF